MKKVPDFFNYIKNQLNQMISGILSLYLNSDILKDCLF
jgi:hypothetical protein